MFRKITTVSLVLFGFLLSRMAGECFADASAGLEQAKLSIISLINEGKYTQAQNQTQKLLADFPQNPALPEVLSEIADRYRWVDKYDNAKDLYQQIIRNYSDSPSVSEANLGIAKVKVLSLIVAQDCNGAGKALDELIANFSNYPDLPEELYWIARKYGWSERHEEEKAVYQHILQNYPDSSFADKAQLGFARATVQALIMSKDYDAAEKALDKMVADFSRHPDLHDAIYWIAGRYLWSGRFEDAKCVYQQIVQNYPDSPSASKAKFGISRAGVLSLMMSQDCNQAEKALDKMIADFGSRSDLPDALLSMGRQCYEQGLAREKDGLADQARDLLEKAARIWEKLITDLPASSFTPEACCWAGDCYFKLGKHQESMRCFQKVVDNYPQYEYAWHAQFTVGRCYEELKDTGAIEKSAADAQINTAYERLLEKYPDCPAAGYAHNWLSREVKVEKEK